VGNTSRERHNLEKTTSSELPGSLHRFLSFDANPSQVRQLLTASPPQAAMPLRVPTASQITLWVTTATFAMNAVAENVLLVRPPDL
jgi:hypothetical protein